jgi:hypothetical protein
MKMTTMNLITILILGVILVKVVMVTYGYINKKAVSLKAKKQQLENEKAVNNAFTKPVESELSDEQKQSLINLKKQVQSFKLQHRIDKLDDLVSKLNSAEYSEEEKLLLADEIAQKVDVTLNGDDVQPKKKNFKVIQGLKQQAKAS